MWNHTTAAGLRTKVKIVEDASECPVCKKPIGIGDYVAKYVTPLGYNHWPHMECTEIANEHDALDHDPENFWHILREHDHEAGTYPGLTSAGHPKRIQSY